MNKTAIQEEINDLERNLQLAKEKIRKQFLDAGFAVEYGVWKLLK